MLIFMLGFGIVRIPELSDFNLFANSLSPFLVISKGLFAVITKSLLDGLFSASIFFGDIVMVN